MVIRTVLSASRVAAAYEQKGCFEGFEAAANGLRIYAMRSANWRDEHLPLVVLVPGLGMSHLYLMPLASQLEPACRVYAYDPPGFGRSAKNAGHIQSLDAQADALAAWCDALGLRSAAFFGNSSGCQILARLAVRHRRLLDRLILQGPTIDPHHHSYREQARRWLLNDEPGTLLPLILVDYARCGPCHFLGMLRAVMGDRIEQHLPFINCPTLIVRGQNDPIVSAAWAKEAAASLANGRLVEMPGGHALNFSFPCTLAHIMAPFLGTCLPTPPPGCDEAARRAHRH